MKQFLRYIFMAVMAFCVIPFGTTTIAEAANIVVLPMVNNVDYPEIESAYYDNVIDCIKQQQQYELIDNDGISAIIDKYATKGILPDEQAIQKISKEANADLVVAFELDKLTYERKYANGNDDLYQLEMSGKAVSYNVSDGKYLVHPFGTSEMLDYGFYVRTNVPIKWWSNAVQHEMHRILNFKGLALQKPKISKIGNYN